jgi:tRNA threonylcarbamoyladenosine modification (KEOPS) complex  Pcc1 subunit
MRIVIEINSPDVARKLDQILAALTRMEITIMATLKDIQDAVAAENTVVDSAITLLTQIHDELAAAIAANDPAALQAVVDSINAEKQKLADAVVANTPAAPPAPAPAA